jgi:hypothetical protein
MGNFDCWTELTTIDFSEGAAFIGDPELDPQHVPGIIEFFSSLTRFDTKKRANHGKDSVVYDAIPEMFIEFASKSRVDHGFHLLSRMVHHAFDSRITPMEHCSAKLIVDMHGTVGIQIKSLIPASMKQSIYETEVAATLIHILCCKCSCQSGSRGEERVVCVHTYVRLYLLSILLHEDLAEHILLELAACIGGCSDAQHTSDQPDDAFND